MKVTSILLSIVATSFILLACKKYKVDNWSTLKKLYKEYKQGEISECKLNNEKVFVAGINGYDAGSYIYNAKGDKIGSCNDAWGIRDSICNQLKNCEVVYRVKNNIWGQAAVDKHKLSH